MRQILLDTETTGFNPKNGDRIVEIGAVELIKRKLTGNHFHEYINPERDMPTEAFQVHGLSEAFLKDKPVFAQIADAFMEYVQGAELIIHNAPFDVPFINHELSLLPNNRWGKLEDHCKITDSLQIARKLYPGQQVSLDALCRKLGIDNSNRTLHGALLDSELLAEVYLLMTGGQTNLILASALETENQNQARNRALAKDRPPLKVIRASETELQAHKIKLQEIAKKSDQQLDW